MISAADEHTTGATTRVEFLPSPPGSVSIITVGFTISEPIIGLENIDITNMKAALLFIIIVKLVECSMVFFFL
jgi:hypothetical protein